MARGINKVILIDNAIEHAKSHRKFSISRDALLKAFKLLDNASESNYYDTDQLKRFRTKLLAALASITRKRFIQPQVNNQNTATTLLFRNKLKPTTDGKDAFIDNKTANKTQLFSINLWNQEHAQSQNRAFA